ncbi:MAG TPA: hypothetical protein VN285_08005, partial [Candidatus Deferrimicrobium sp.]|nr:hypothetical protein [Candidatus Deferrimicrobium sp.]
DRARATVLTKVAFSQIDARVLPEMSARVHFLMESADTASAQQRATVVIPKEALTTRDGARVVFVVKGDRAVMRAVQTGRELGATVEVLGGVQAGERVVLSPPGKMSTGQKVEISY